MCRAIIKNAIYICLFLAIILLLTGCILTPIIGSGYTVSISVRDDVHPKVADIEFLDKVAENERFANRRISSSPTGNRDCVHYYRDLESSQFQHLQRYKFISLGYCYDFQQPLADTKQNIEPFYVNIANDWAGQDSSIKQEIDRLADIFYRELSNRFGKENIKIKRRRTGPPF